MLGRGVYAMVDADMLGHSQIVVPADVHAHVTPMMESQAAQALDALLRA